MIGWWRALRGELYALVRRRSFRLALVSVILLVPIRVAVAFLWLRIQEGGGGADPLAANHFNFWPRFAQGSRFGLVLGELSSLVLIGGALPREIRDGVVRDPMVRRISRNAFVLARAAVALLLPLFLGTVAVTSSAVAASIFFDGGHIVTEPVSVMEDPENEAAYAAWLEAQDVRPDQVAAYFHLLDEGVEDTEARERSGFQAAAFPDDYYAFVPILIGLEEDIRGDVMSSLRQGLLPLAALGLFAFLLSVVFPTGALAAGVAFGAVILLGVFLTPELGDAGWWFSSSWLPGVGYHSTLAVAQLIADGYTDTPPTADAALRAAWQGSLAASAVSLVLATTVFPRRRL